LPHKGKGKAKFEGISCWEGPEKNQVRWEMGINRVKGRDKEKEARDRCVSSESSEKKTKVQTKGEPASPGEGTNKKAGGIIAQGPGNAKRRG